MLLQLKVSVVLVCSCSLPSLIKQVQNEVFVPPMSIHQTPCQTFNISVFTTKFELFITQNSAYVEICDLLGHNVEDMDTLLIILVDMFLTKIQSVLVAAGEFVKKYCQNLH